MIATKAEQKSGMPIVSPVELVEPSLDRLPGYVAALEAGWSPDTTRDVGGEQLEAIRNDAKSFVAELVRRENGTITLADGTKVPRLPGRVLWIWDGDFSGAINLRFVPGTEALPPHVSGHVGYAVVPWKRNRGYARHALRLLLPIAHEFGLQRLLINCDEDNVPSRRVIESNGGVLAGETTRHTGKRKFLFWVSTAA